MLIRGDFAELANAQFPEVNGPTAEMVAAAAHVKKEMLRVKSWQPAMLQDWFKGMLAKGDEGIKGKNTHKISFAPFYSY